MIYSENKNGFNYRPLVTVFFITAVLLILNISTYAGQRVISSLPVTFKQSDHSVDAWDTITVAGTKLVSATDGILFEGTYNWFVDLGQDTIVYGQGSTSAQWNSYGINFRGRGYDGSYNIIISGGFILNDPQGIDTLTYSPQDTLSGRCNGITAGFACHDITVDGTFIRSAAYSSHCISLGGDGGYLIKNTILDQAAPGFHSRGQFDACAIKGAPGSGWLRTNLANNCIKNDYHVELDNVKVLRSCHAGFFFHGGEDAAVIAIKSCTLVVDSRNIMYPVTDGFTHHGRANCYAIQITRAGPGCLIKKNHITAGESHHGGRGIQFVASVGQPDNPVAVCSNYVAVHESADVAFTGAYGYFPCAMKIRQRCRGIHMYDNQFIYIADGSVARGTTSGSYYLYGEAGLYEHWTTESPPFYITIERNLFRSIDRNSGAYISAFTFDNADRAPDPSFIWRNNRLESDYIAYRWGGYDGEAHSVIMRGDTVRLVDTSNATVWAYQLGYLNMNYRTDDIVAIDMTYEGVANDTRINFPSNQGSSDITLQRTLYIYVKGNNDLPVTNANVTVRNNYGQTIINGSTNNGGRIIGTVTYNFQSRGLSDSTNFNNFTIDVSKGGDNTQGSMTVGWNSYRDTLLLPATIGDGEWEPDEVVDTIPPAAIDDLGAVPDNEVFMMSNSIDVGSESGCDYYSTPGIINSRSKLRVVNSFRSFLA
jgi:hypothetical protein